MVPTRGLAVASIAALMFGCSVSFVQAHDETALHALSALDRVEPEIPGVSFRVVQITQPALLATNRSDEPLVVFGSEGEPFLRIHGGRVESNLNSPLTYISRDPAGGHSVAQQDIDPTERPQWQLVEKGSRWSWFDPRIRFAPGRHSWRLDARVGDRDVAITGHLEPLEGHGHFRSELAGAPVVEGLEVRLLDGLVPALYVKNDTGRLLQVPGRHGEPFLRIGPKGVFGNLSSPDYYLGGDQTIRPVPKSARPGARPRWDRLSTVPVWSWLEFRARLPVRLQQRSLLGDETRTVLEWTTPMELGGEPLEFPGLVRWIPPQLAADESSSVTTAQFIGLSAIVGAIIVAFVLWPRRRRR